MLNILLVAIGILAVTPAIKHSGLSSMDIAVYQAVLEEEILPLNDFHCAYLDIPRPAPLIVLDRTIAICPPPPIPTDQRDCIREKSIDSFDEKDSQGQQQLFNGLIDAASRAELYRSLRERNAENHTFPGARIEGLIYASPDGLDETRKREEDRTVSSVAFAMPAYSSDGHALVYLDFYCGFCCGFGGYFLLRRYEDSWHVISHVVLWYS